MAITKNGNRHQCYSCEILCIECGSPEPLVRGFDDSIKFWVCDKCFSKWFIAIDSSIKGVYYIKLIYPFECFILRSRTLDAAVQSAIDFNGLNDVNGDRKWKKTLQKM